VKQASKGKRRSKAVPALGAAGLSLSLASAASAATSGAALDTLTRNAGTNHEITLRDEEVCDVSLATFYVFDKERAGAFPFLTGKRFASCGGCAGCVFACLAGQAASGNYAYSPPASLPIRSAHKPVRKRR
jgi:NAD-dependent dihydropyrimidine dehydrogenase PreA subunit